MNSIQDAGAWCRYGCTMRSRPEEPSWSGSALNVVQNFYATLSWRTCGLSLTIGVDAPNIDVLWINCQQSTSRVLIGSPSGLDPADTPRLEYSTAVYFWLVDAETTTKLRSGDNLYQIALPVAVLDSGFCVSPPVPRQSRHRSAWMSERLRVALSCTWARSW